MIYCPQCGERMAINDRTTRVIQHACPSCHEEKIEIRGRGKDRWNWNRN